MAIDAEIIEGFQQESFDLLEEVEPMLISIANDASEGKALDLEEINAIFRTFHTIKGCAASIGLKLLTDIAHEAESMLVLFRGQDHEYKAEYTEILCESTDLLRNIIEKLDHENYEDDFHDNAKELILRFQEHSKSIISGSEIVKTQPSNNKVEPKAPDSKLDNTVSIKKETTHKKTPLSGDLDQGMITQFISDGYDFLSNVEASLLSLQENPDQNDTVQYAYRQMHSFKGNCSLMEYLDLEKLSHAIESTLSSYRDSKKSIDFESPAICLKFIDILRGGLRFLEDGFVPDIPDINIYIDLLNDTAPGKSPSTASEELMTSDVQQSMEYQSEEEERAQERICVVEDSVLSRKKIKNLLESQNYQVIEASDGLEALEILRSDEIPNCQLVITDLGMPRMDGNELVRIINSEFRDMPVVILSGAEDVNIFKKLIGHDLSGFVPKNVPRAELFAMVKKALRDGTKRKLLSSAFNSGDNQESSVKIKNDIRVDMRKLDSMINLVGELIIAEALVTANPEVTNLKIASFEKYSEQLRGIIGELHDVTLSLRMVPVEGLFKKMIRVVHDASKKTDKKVRLETFGEDTELDKIVTDVLSDPLVHMIRNSVDHGIEKTDSRLRKKKK